jgi:hypothetical protein
MRCCFGGPVAYVIHNDEWLLNRAKVIVVHSVALGEYYSNKTRDKSKKNNGCQWMLMPKTFKPINHRCLHVSYEE